MELALTGGARRAVEAAMMMPRSQFSPKVMMM
jgi:hypothetical protein